MIKKCQENWNKIKKLIKKKNKNIEEIKKKKEKQLLTIEINDNLIWLIDFIFLTTKKA